jgi:hypothetical protein
MVKWRHLPKYAITGLIGLPDPNNGNITGQCLFHKICPTVENPRFPLFAVLYHFSRSVKADGNLSLLEQSI